MKKYIGVFGIIIIMVSSVLAAVDNFGLTDINFKKIQKNITIPTPVISSMKTNVKVTPVEIKITGDKRVKAYATGTFVARKNSFFCTKLKLDEGGAIIRVPKTKYPIFKQEKDLISVPFQIDSKCEYTRTNMGLSFYIPGYAEAYNEVSIFPGDSSGEQTVSCKVIISGPSNAKKPMLACYGDITLNAENKATVKVILEK